MRAHQEALKGLTVCEEAAAAPVHLAQDLEDSGVDVESPERKGRNPATH